MHITFVVKHDKDANAAQGYVNKRGISGLMTAATSHEAVFRTTTMDLRDLEAIAQWFAENPPIIQGQGYPVGTLLIYSIHEDTRG